MLRRFPGNNGTRKPGPSLQELIDEREAVEETMKRATEEGRPQEVTVGQERFIVTDPGRVGREIKPA